MGRNTVKRYVCGRYAPHKSGMDAVWTNRPVLSSILVLLIITAWSYGPVVRELSAAWQNEANYSAGQLVPLVAVFLVWRERNTVRRCTLTPCWWGGTMLLVFAGATRIYGLLSFRSSPERYALVLTVGGLVLLVAGWQVLRRLLWILLFLFLMVPLPGRIHNMVSGPLQRIATTGSVLLLEVLGISVNQQGNIVVLNGNMPLAVAEACSGLRMLMAFIIVAAFIAYMVKRPRWQKAVLLVSSIPVAVVCNVVRIFVTAVLMLHVGTEMAQRFFHDFAGYVMMPVAVMLLFGEIWLMDRIIISDDEAQLKQVTARAKPKRAVRGERSPNVADCA